MEWSDDAIVLSARRHGESAAVAVLLTRDHGRHAGLVRGGGGRRGRGVLQPGNAVHATWRARLADHLGTWTLEAGRAYGAAVLDDAAALAGLVSACAVVEAAVPEREPHPLVFEGLAVLLDSLTDPSWPSVYVKFELGLLGELGFGLDFTACAATGATADLAYVSPKSGRAVSRAAGAPYRDRLLPLPSFLLVDGGEGEAAEVAAALALTGHFLERHALAHQRGGLPAARRRLVERVRGQGGGAR